MQKIGIVICSRDIEDVLIKGKRILSANQSSLYYKIQSNWKGYAKSSRKFVMAEAKDISTALQLGWSENTYLIIYKDKASEEKITFCDCFKQVFFFFFFSQKVETVGLIVKFTNIFVSNQ